MTENLAQLKQFFPVLAAAAGIAVFALVHILANLLLDRIFRGRYGKVILSDDVFCLEDDKILRYEKIIRKENAKCTWMMKAAVFLSLVMLCAAACFHSRLIEKTGPELFASAILTLSVSAAFLILQDKRWNTGAAVDLILYSALFLAAAPDEHTGIRMMLSDPDTDFPLKSLLLEIQKDDPEISGKDLMTAAGEILHSDAMVKAFSDKKRNPAEARAGEIQSGRTDTYGTIFGLLAFGIMIVLCFLL